MTLSTLSLVDLTILQKKILNKTLCFWLGIILTFDAKFANFVTECFVWALNIIQTFFGTFTVATDVTHWFVRILIFTIFIIQAPCTLNDQQMI